MTIRKGIRAIVAAARLSGSRKLRTSMSEPRGSTTIGIECKSCGHRFQITLPNPLTAELDVRCPRCGIVQNLVQRADLTELHFEVMVGKARQKEGTRTLDLATLSVHGTAFAIADGLFVTAGHVYADALAEADQNDGKVVLVKQGQHQHANFVSDGEVFTPSDLAIMSCNVTHAAMPVSFEPLEIFHDVQANGFPFGQERMQDRKST